MKKHVCCWLVVLSMSLFASTSQGAKIVHLKYDNDGSGGLDLSDSGTAGGSAVNYGAVLGNKAGQVGTGSALLSETADYTSKATGKSDMAQGAVQVSIALDSTNPTPCRIIEVLGASDAARFYIDAVRDGSGWYLDVRAYTPLSGTWALRQVVTNWGGPRINIMDGGWHTLTFTWGPAGMELYIGKVLVGSWAANTNAIGQLWVLNTGSKAVVTALGYYDEVKLYDTQDIPKQGSVVAVR